MAKIAVDILLERLNQIRMGQTDCRFSVVKMNQMSRLYEEFESLRTCLEDLEKNRSELEAVEDLLTQIRDAAYEAADIIDLSLVNRISQKEMLKERERQQLRQQREREMEEGELIRQLRQMQEMAGKLSYKCKKYLLAKSRRMALSYQAANISDVVKEIKSIKKQVTKIYQKKLCGIGVPQVGMSFHVSSSRKHDLPEEIVFGFDHDAEMLKERLTGMPKQLEVISIIGMAGLGKTTLARKLYSDPFILYHFYIRGWTYVSQVYRKRDLLLGILTSVFKHKDETSMESDEKLGQVLYKCLKGKRYLLVMDDMWDVGAWNDLKIYFPNDDNGSRILFTSRHTHVALQAKHDSLPHYLRFLNEDESWDLLEKKIFGKESCPPELTDIGKQIAKKCQGLPLAIVVVAGLLAKTDKIQDWWKQVAENLSSYIVSDTEQCLNILALSYNNLPCHLKSCFLYLGAFPEDYEISVRMLIWLWIAEGFIQPIGHESKSLEDVAEEYLMNLIDRNLVLVAKRRSTGGIKACRVHDLLHDLCLRKAKEENFLQQIYRSSEDSTSSPIANKQLFMQIRSKIYDFLHSFLKIANDGQHSSSSSSSLVHLRKQHRRLCVDSHTFCYIPSKPFAPHIRSFLCFVSEQSSLSPKNMPFICQAFILLRVLDLSAISISIFPNQIRHLYLLRYLAFQGKHLGVPTSIANLQNLEILIMLQGTGSFIPDTIWYIATLRHLRIAGVNFIDGMPNFLRFPIVLPNLQSISHICPTGNCGRLLAWTPNIRKLGFCGRFDSLNDCFWFPDLDFLYHLETLELLTRHVPDHHTYNLQGVKFPPNLKKLTLSNTALEWKEMSVLGMLPNLEVLKLEFQACIGSLWETIDGGFRRLKYLRLFYMNVEQWNASSIHFPSLQHLVLLRCRKLREVPSELGDICTLQTIEVSCCSDSAVNSAREIQKEQEGMGNDSLKIIIVNPLDLELETYS